MNTVVYRTTEQLECQCDTDVVICLDPALVAGGIPFLQGFLIKTLTSVNACGATVYAYYIDYQESLLINPQYSLVNSDILGVFCKDCLVSYMDYFFSTYSTNLFRPTPGDLYVYVWPPGPPPFPPGDPLVVDVVSVIGNVVTLGWHSVVVEP